MSRTLHRQHCLDTIHLQLFLRSTDRFRTSRPGRLRWGKKAGLHSPSVHDLEKRCVCVCLRTANTVYSLPSSVSAQSRTDRLTGLQCKYYAGAAVGMGAAALMYTDKYLQTNIDHTGRSLVDVLAGLTVRLIPCQIPALSSQRSSADVPDLPGRRQVCT